MKSILETWKRFLTEGTFVSSVVLPQRFTGIIQLQPAETSFLQAIQDKIVNQFPDQKPITKLHVTLLHQAIPKKVFSKTMVGGTGNFLRGDKALKAFFKSPEAAKLILPELTFGTTGIKSEGDRTSSYIEVSNPEVLRGYLMGVYAACGLDLGEIAAASAAEPREAGRIFHISLTNLTGMPGDSLANINNGTELKL